MKMNIEKYLNEANVCNSSYGNGLIYKNDDAFKNKSKYICYISENALDDLEDLFIDGIDLTDEELIEQGYAESYNSILGKVEQAGFSSNQDAHSITEYIYSIADWAYISTYIEEYKEVF